MRRLLLSFGAAAAMLVGCLFPSFDGLKNDDNAAGGDDDDDGNDASTKKKDSGESSTSSSGETSSSSSGEPIDTGAPDTSTTPQKKTIDCDGKICDVDTQFCCDEGFDNTECKPKGAGCSPWRFACDDFTDCPEGQECCHELGALAVTCTASCNGERICNSGRPCKTGTCGGELTGPPGVTVKVCE